MDKPATEITALVEMLLEAKRRLRAAQQEHDLIQRMYTEAMRPVTISQHPGLICAPRRV